MNNSIVSRVWEQNTLSCKDSNNKESMKLPPVGETEPEQKPQLGPKVVFWAGKI